MAKKKYYHYVLVCSSDGAVFVTKISKEELTAVWDKGKKPLKLTETLAEDITFGLNANFFTAYHIKSEFEISHQPYRYKAGHFEWVWDKDEQKTRKVEQMTRENKCASCIHCEMCRWIDEVKQAGCDFYAESCKEWIPVEDELPKKSDNYLVSVVDAENDDDLATIDIAWFAHPDDYGLKEGEWRELFEGYKVIAWKPSPKPYKPERKEK